MLNKLPIGLTALTLFAVEDSSAMKLSNHDLQK